MLPHPTVDVCGVRTAYPRTLCSFWLDDESETFTFRAEQVVVDAT
jgi:hypothetical protein